MLMMPVCCTRGEIGINDWLATRFNQPDLEKLAAAGENLTLHNYSESKEIYVVLRPEIHLKVEKRFSWLHMCSNDYTQLITLTCVL